jgi:hypothetical protein
MAAVPQGCGVIRLVKFKCFVYNALKSRSLRDVAEIKLHPNCYLLLIATWLRWLNVSLNSRTVTTVAINPGHPEVIAEIPPC